MTENKYSKWNHMESDMPIDPTIDREKGHGKEPLDKKVNKETEKEEKEEKDKSAEK